MTLCELLGYNVVTVSPTLRRSDMTKDYTITMQDSSGKRVTLYIDGASIDANGGDSYAVECVENNAFDIAVFNGLIGADAYLVDPLDQE